MFRKDKKEGQPGIGLAKPCVSTRGPEALSQKTTGLPFRFLIFLLAHIYLPLDGGYGRVGEEGGDVGGGHFYTTIPAKMSDFIWVRNTFWFGLFLRSSIEFQAVAKDISGILLKSSIPWGNT